MVDFDLGFCFLFFRFCCTDATCLLNSGIVHLTCSGYQKEASLSSFIHKDAGSYLIVIED